MDEIIAMLKQKYKMTDAEAQSFASHIISGTDPNSVGMRQDAVAYRKPTPKPGPVISLAGPGQGMAGSDDFSIDIGGHATARSLKTPAPEHEMRQAKLRDQRDVYQTQKGMEHAIHNSPAPSSWFQPLVHAFSKKSGR